MSQQCQANMNNIESNKDRQLRFIIDSNNYNQPSSASGLDKFIKHQVDIKENDKSNIKVPEVLITNKTNDVGVMHTFLPIKGTQREKKQLPLMYETVIQSIK